MKSIWTYAVLAALVFCASPTAPRARAAVSATATATDVPVDQVILYSSGVGFFRHAGTVDGDTDAELHFKTDQINDVLKSLVVMDSGGTIGTVTYPSQDPVQKILQSFQVDISDNPALDQLLNRLRGAKITLTLPSETVAGTILGVEKRTKSAGENKTYTVPVINLISGASIRSVELTDVRDLHLEDAVLQDELAKALAAVAAARDQEKKPVTVHFKGNGKRSVVLGYVVETPVWKTSYRLILGNDPKKPGDIMQGWAIVENQTDNDWSNVKLGLVCGRPISFIEDLYSPLYVPRPVVIPDIFMGLSPQVDQGGMGGGAQEAGGQENERRILKQDQKSLQQHAFSFAGNQADATAAPAPVMTSPTNGATGDLPANYTASVISQASAADLGDLFEYTVAGVSLPRQSSAMIPIVSDPIKIDRLSIFNPEVLPHNPLYGARLTNSTGKHLLAGPISVYDGDTYAGDAQINSVPPGQSRLISYGVDLEIAFRTETPDETADLVTGKIVAGTLQVTRKHIAVTSYIAQNKSDHDKTIVIEHPFHQGWTLTDPPNPVEKTDRLERFQESLPAGKSATLQVKEQLVQDEGYALLDGDFDTIVYYSQRGEIPQSVKDSLAKAIALKRDMADAQRQLDADKAMESQIGDDQTRIRANLQTIDKTAPLYGRLLTKLNDQETKLEDLRTDEEKQTGHINDVHKQLEDYLGNLNVS